MHESKVQVYDLWSNPAQEWFLLQKKQMGSLNLNYNDQDDLVIDLANLKSPFGDPLYQQNLPEESKLRRLASDISFIKFKVTHYNMVMLFIVALILTFVYNTHLTSSVNRATQRTSIIEPVSLRYSTFFRSQKQFTYGSQIEGIDENLSQQIQNVDKSAEKIGEEAEQKVQRYL
eukprot:TRINITY_DN12799_c0_g1_i1.p2 TRINITY_DN12799_c0_g1~~TRINITY_DN12799_c0_g1_i1.p2  ORF type:complete len:174 (+),score=17.77 TRINITY_DN12799_c0_g1_i1:103-624(+)